MTTTTFLFLLLAGCTIGETITDDDDPVGGKADGVGPPGLPNISPWGGEDPARWTPEAVLANAATAELLREPAARVSIPAALLTSDLAPFGDGQTDAAASLGVWREMRPPVVGVRRGAHVTVRFDRALALDSDTFELWSTDGVWQRSLASTRAASGDWIVELDNAPMQLVVSPRGWRDGFPLSFEVPKASVDALAETGPAGIVDPLGVAGSDSYGALRGTNFPAGWNQHPFVTDSVHAVYPTGAAPRITAVGGAATWLATEPLKNIYICFDPRDPGREAQYGVPSGAGWHHIGDAGESLVASLDAAPLLVGYAASTAPAPPANGDHAYGLDRALVFALLEPGQAFTTPRGDFHWYAVHHATHPCVQIWVHACEPRGATLGCEP